MSVPQIPQAPTRNSSSPSSISGIGTDSTTTRPLPRYTPARMCPRLDSCASCDPICSMVWLIFFFKVARSRRCHPRSFLQGLKSVCYGRDKLVQKTRQCFRRCLAVLPEADEIWDGCWMQRNLSEDARNAHLAFVGENPVHIERELVVDCVTDGPDRDRWNSVRCRLQKYFKAFHFHGVRMLAQVPLLFRSTYHALGAVELVHCGRATFRCERKQRRAARLRITAWIRQLTFGAYGTRRQNLPHLVFRLARARQPGRYTKIDRVRIASQNFRCFQVRLLRPRSGQNHANFGGANLRAKHISVTPLAGAKLAHRAPRREFIFEREGDEYFHFVFLCRRSLRHA